MAKEQNRTAAHLWLCRNAAEALISDSNKDVTYYLLFDEALALGLAVGQSLTVVFQICDNALDAVDVDLTQVLLYAVQHRLQTPYMSAQRSILYNKLEKLPSIKDLSQTTICNWK